MDDDKERRKLLASAGKHPQKPNSDEPSQPSLPLIGESVMRDPQRAEEGKNFAGLPSARAEAQELALAAMKAETEEQAREFAQQALAKDSFCVDALVIMAGLDARTAKEAIAALEKAVEAGERSLGAKFFAENKGHFWGILETRPYMRARAELAALHRGAGHVRKAIAHYEALLDLNPNDNQGVRGELLGCYLTAADLKGTRRLLQQYDKDVVATFAWGRVLERYLSCDLAGASAALAKARKGNRFVELYLSAMKTRVPAKS